MKEALNKISRQITLYIMYKIGRRDEEILQIDTKNAPQ